MVIPKIRSDPSKPYRKGRMREIRRLQYSTSQQFDKDFIKN
jgi:hypothetical protein